jgi:hypothetical protein
MFRYDELRGGDQSIAFSMLPVAVLLGKAAAMFGMWGDG